MRSGQIGVGVSSGITGWWLWLGPGKWEPFTDEWKIRGVGWEIGEKDKPVPRLRAFLIMGNEFFKLADCLSGPLLPKETSK